MRDDPRHDLPADSFPFTIRACSSLTGEVVWEKRITGPERIYIPPLAKMIGCPVTISILWPDGRITSSEIGGAVTAAPRFADCALPDDCQCRLRLRADTHHIACVVPAINQTADELGWQRPYPQVEQGSDP